MKIPRRFGFWVEVISASLTSFLFAVTIVWNDWIEIIFKIDPDSGNGSFERLIVMTLFVISVMLFVLARFEWRRTRTTNI